MSYLVLARKWRPQRFEDLVGQDHVAKTLANAIRKDRVAHALLFSGARGVGKTSAARILAKALNCREGPTPEPCGRCDACETITSGSAVDVHEIDGASNNSVEDVRQLRENVPYQPSSLRFKVYVVDEVHMLSKNAFNALLKTLEEPPPHVKFILATTEPEKIPITILSRCQRYDFRKITARQIAGRLDRILEAEKIAVEPDAVRTIAREAAGSMRDALSMLDQAVAACPEGVSARDLAWVLGVTPRALVLRALEAILGRDVRGCLETVHGADEGGYDLNHFARSLLGGLRDLIVVASCPGADGLVDVPDADLARLRELAGGATVAHLHRLFGLASRLVDDLARSPMPQVHLEIALARMATADSIVPIEDILARLDRLGAGSPRAGGAPRDGESAGDAGGSGRPGARAEEPALPRERDERPREPPPPPPPVEDAATPPPLPAEASADERPGEVDGALWSRILREVGAGDPPLAATLGHAVPLALAPSGVRLAFPDDSTAAGMLRQERHSSALSAAIERTLGVGVPIRVEEGSEPAKAAIAARAAEQSLADERSRREVRDHPAVRETVNAFEGSRVVEVRLGRGAGPARR